MFPETINTVDARRLANTNGRGSYDIFLGRLFTSYTHFAHLVLVLVMDQSRVRARAKLRKAWQLTDLPAATFHTSIV